MKKLSEIIKNHRIIITASDTDGGHGIIPGLDPKKPNKSAEVQWSNGLGWNHVSVSWTNRCPSWDEMCKIKDIFFNKDEWVMELHPPESEYVNFHPYCLHLWQPQNQQIPTPPSFMVGPKHGQSIRDIMDEANSYAKDYYKTEAAQ